MNAKEEAPHLAFRPSPFAFSSDSPEFIDGLAGIYRDCKRLEESARTIVHGVARRVEAIQRNWYLRKVELGEALLQVQQERPGEFDAWLAAHRAQLGFSRDTAYRCKATALKVRELGIEGALLALTEEKHDRPEPFLSLRFTLPVSPEDVPTEEIPAILDRLRPAHEAYEALSARAPAPSA